MALGTFSNESLTEVGAGPTHLLYEFDYTYATPSDLSEGFLLWYTTDTGVTIPVWTEPPAVDVGLPQGDGDSTIEHFALLLHLSDDHVTWYETFEEYEAGTIADISLLASGGAMWSAGWGGTELYTFTVFLDDFESYSLGAVADITTLGGGTGWASNWAGVSI